jgi:hypothetical protein
MTGTTKTNEADLAEHRFLRALPLRCLSAMAGEATRGLAGERAARIVGAVRIAPLARANVYRERKRSLSAS